MKSLKDYNKEELNELISHLEDELFLSHKLKAKIGAELEFYLLHKDEDEETVLDLICQKCDRVDKERGWHQHECVLEYTDNLNNLAAQLDDLKGHISVSARQHGIKAEFSPKPFEGEYGSALHLHLTLHDEYGVNIFSRLTYDDNVYLQQVIAGMLAVTSEATYLLSKDDRDFNRFIDTEFMAPTHISWGGNNRTTTVRIPDSQPINRRIEYRLPHANSNPQMAVIIILLSALYGLDDKLIPQQRTYGNAFDEIYELPRLPKTLQEAQNKFENNEKIAHYIHRMNQRIKTA